MFSAGRGVPQSNFQSYVWFARAARAGHADAKARQEQVKVTLQPAEIQHAEKLLR
jgi:TPR repeat protein